LMFLPSWTPSWPPELGYYWGIYSGVPPAGPGTSGSASFSLTAPSTFGTYYLWFVFDANYGYAQAAADFKTPLSTPAHIRIVVSNTGVSGQITAVSVDKQVLLLTDTISFSVTVKNTGNAASSYYLSATLFGPTHGYRVLLANSIQLAQGASALLTLYWSPQMLQPSVDPGSYTVVAFLWNEQPNVTPIPSTLNILASYTLPFAFMVENGRSYIEVTGGNCDSLGGACRLIHVHFSRDDLGAAKTFGDLFWLLQTTDLTLSLAGLAGGGGPGVGDIVSVVQYVLGQYDRSQQLKVDSEYGFYDVTIMQVIGRYGKYYETSLVKLQAAAYQDLLSKLASLGITMALVIAEVAVAVTFPLLAPVIAVQLWTTLAISAGQTIWYAFSFFNKIPSSFFLNGNVPAYGIVRFQKLYTTLTQVSKEQVFSTLDAYFSDSPCPYTGNRVPTKEDIFRLLDEYFGEG
jgi:hypothetical protein